MSWVLRLFSYFIEARPLGRRVGTWIVQHGMCLMGRLLHWRVRKEIGIPPADRIDYIVQNRGGLRILNTGGSDMIRYGFMAFLVLLVGVSSAAPRVVLGEDVTNTG